MRATPAGFIQCKDRYRNQTQLMDVARGYVTRGLPISTIVIDWKHWVAQGACHKAASCPACVPWRDTTTRAAPASRQCTRLRVLPRR